MTEDDAGRLLVTLAKGLRAVKALMDLDEAETSVSLDEARIHRLRNVGEKDYRFAEFTRALSACGSIPNPPDGNYEWTNFYLERPE